MCDFIFKVKFKKQETFKIIALYLVRRSQIQKMGY